jgi:DNA-binding CsgD family transcriptional regulator
MPPTGELAQFESIGLFLERVRAFQPDFVLDESQAADVATICAQLDGLPLAIELAAARIRVLTPAALCERLGKRLDVLTGGGPEQAAHQQTMRSTIAWSFDLLTAEEQQLFRRLAVFAGTFDLDAAEAVAGEESPSHRAAPTFDTLISLIDQSLVRREANVDAPRFRMLATIREFAREELDASEDSTSIRHRFAHYMGAVVAQATPHLTNLDQVTWAQRLDREQPNIEAALTWLDTNGDDEWLLAMLSSLQPFWLMRGQFHVGRTWMERGIAVADTSPELPAWLRFNVYLDAAILALAYGDHKFAMRYGSLGQELARREDDKRALAKAFRLLGMLAHRKTDYQQARDCMMVAIELSEALDDQVGVAWALNTLATITMDVGDLAGAESLFSQARALFDRNRNAYGAAMASDNLSVALFSRDEVREAMTLAERALVIFRTLGDARRTAIALDHVGKCARRLGDLDRSWLMHRDSLELRIQYGDPRGLAVWLEAVAALLAARGDAIPAARILGATGKVRSTHGVPLHGNEAIDHDRVIEHLTRLLGPDVLQAHETDGQRMAVNEAISLAVGTIDHAPSLPASPPGPLAKYNLTPREMEVLDLLTRRLSDREIADALFISTRTVARHLAGIFAKLDVHSRREAAQLARATASLAED